MADLGELNTKVVSIDKHTPASSWQQYRSPTMKNIVIEKIQSIGADTSGVLQGTVLDGTSPVADCPVVVFCRRSKRPVYATTTNAGGGFSVTGVVTGGAANFFAIAFPPDGLDRNALIFDNVTAD